MSDNVVPFPFQRTEAEPQPISGDMSEEDFAQFNTMIAVLEYSLERVRAGEINGVAIILGEPDGKAQYALPITRMAHLTAFVGAAEQMKLDLAEEIRTRRIAAVEA